MIKILENMYLKVAINRVGAEVKAITNKEDGSEVLWLQDDSVWGRVSPILFPIVGKLKDGKVEVAGNQYAMGRHGFLRDSDFKCVASDETSAVYQLTWSEESLRSYPYKFCVEITYTLEGKKLIQDIKVSNVGQKIMYYNIGLHPGFNIQIDHKENNILFEDQIDYNSYLLKEGLMSDETYPVNHTGNKMNINRDLFQYDTVLFKLKPDLSLLLERGGFKSDIMVSYSGYDYLAFWSPLGDIICIEPWAGIPDHVNDSGKIEEKTAVRQLDLGEEDTFSMSITCL